jgi:hypothetical protein
MASHRAGVFHGRHLNSVRRRDTWSPRQQIWANHRCRLSCCSWRKLALSGTGDIRRSQPETKTVLSVSDDSKNVVRKVDDRYGRAGASGCLQEGAPGRAARSPATAAVLILLPKTGKGCQLPQKPNGLRRRETAGKPGQKTKAITDPSGWFVKPLSRIGAQGRKPGRKDRAAVRCPPAPKRRRQKAWNANASDRLTTGPDTMRGQDDTHQAETDLQSKFLGKER